MKPASIVELRKELQHLSSEELRLICIRLAKHSKENKELLSYLLFESQDEINFIQNVKILLLDDFSVMDRGGRRMTKKWIRRILRDLKKYAKFSGKKETEIELLIWFCEQLKINMCEIGFQDPMMDSLYARQIVRIQNLMKGLHEDLQHDYQVALVELENV